MCMLVTVDTARQDISRPAEAVEAAQSWRGAVAHAFACGATASVPVFTTAMLGPAGLFHGGLQDVFDDVGSNRLATPVVAAVAMQITSDEGQSSDLMSVEGMDMTLALELSQKGINDREELAEQSIDELTSLIQISEEDAGELIMKARAHWFE